MKNEWMNEWMNEWINELMNDEWWMNDKWMNKWMSEWINEEQRKKGKKELAQKSFYIRCQDNDNTFIVVTSFILITSVFNFP